MIRIEFAPYEELTSEDWDRIIDFINMYGNEVKVIESEEEEMTKEREKAINEWLETHCRTCIENLDRGTEFVNCQAECEVQIDEGIACIHYEEAYDIEPQEREDNMEYVFVKDNLFAPTQTYKMPICKCKKDNVVNVETITERDDFIYDKCMTCGKMIEGSARPWDYENL